MEIYTLGTSNRSIEDYNPSSTCPRKKVIYTIGTSNRSIEDFLEILKEYQIQTVIDVRRWPTSKWFEHFKKENLEKILAENNIEYLHFETLGGYRSGGYEAYTKTKEFKEALKELIKIAKSKNLVVICAEKLPWKCHRAYIARALEKKKFEIVHIIEKDRIWQPKKEPREIKPQCQKKIKIKNGPNMKNGLKGYQKRK